MNKIRSNGIGKAISTTNKATDAPRAEDFMKTLRIPLAEAMEYITDTWPQVSGTLRDQIDQVVAEVYGILEQRGEDYGEDVIFLTGESALVTMSVWKVMRNLHGYTQGDSFRKRRDHYLDQIGYCLIALAMEEHYHENVRTYVNSLGYGDVPAVAREWGFATAKTHEELYECIVAKGENSSWPDVMSYIDSLVTAKGE